VAAKVGDEITVAVPDAAVLAAAFVAYLLPLLGLLAGAAVAASTGMGDPEVALGAALGLVAGIVLARWQSGRLTAHLTPTINARASR
jgi:sigma-E factor negative regulatory protein RseC